MVSSSAVLHTDIPFRLDRLPLSRFHLLVVSGLGITWILDGLDFTPRSGAMRRCFQCNILGQTCHRRGQPGLHSCSQRLCWLSCPTRRTTSFTSTLSFQGGCPT